MIFEWLIISILQGSTVAREASDKEKVLSRLCERQSTVVHICTYHLTRSDLWIFKKKTTQRRKLSLKICLWRYSYWLSASVLKWFQSNSSAFFLSYLSGNIFAFRQWACFKKSPYFGQLLKLECPNSCFLQSCDCNKQTIALEVSVFQIMS